MRHYIYILVIALGLLSACNGDNLPSITTNNPPSTNPPTTNTGYKSLTITGDLKESALLDEVLSYHAIGITNTNKESDLTNQVSWAVDSTILEKIQNGQYKVIAYPSSGQTTISATYPNDDKPIESAVSINISKDILKITHITIYPQESIYLTMASGKVATYQLSVKGYDSNNNEYNLDPHQQVWRISPNISDTSISESGYLQVKQAGVYDISVEYSPDGLMIESSITKVIASDLTTTPVIESNIESNIILGIPNQIFYISAESLVKSCPVSSLASIDSNAPAHIAESNHIALATQCTNYIIPGITPKGNKLIYNAKYNKIYTSDKDTIYSIDPITHKVAQYHMSFPIMDLANDSYESYIYTLSINTDNSYMYNAWISKCQINNDGSIPAICNNYPPTELGFAHDDNTNLTESYLLFTKDNSGQDRLYMFMLVNIPNYHFNQIMVLNDIIIESYDYPNIAFNTMYSDSPYWTYNIHLSRPSLIKAKDADYIYSIGLESSINPGVAIPNSLQIESDSTLKVNYESSSVIGATGYSNGNITNTYSNIALDTQHKWAYYGRLPNDNKLRKCSYEQIESNGKIAGVCLDVTNFPDTFAGITFIPGNQSNWHESNLHNVFFITQAHIKPREDQQIVVQCARYNNESIVENKCFKYAIPDITSKTKLVLNKYYNKIYVVNGSNTIYVINPFNHKVNAYTLTSQDVKAIDFTTKSDHVYMLSNKGLVTYLANCQLSESGAITNVCSRIKPLTTATNLQHFNMITYKDNYIYLMLDFIIYKCDIANNGIDVTQCKLIKTINNSDNINYNTPANSAFTKFSGIRESVNTTPFIYINANINANYFIWPAAINTTTGELELNSANVSSPTETKLINRGGTGVMGKLSFYDPEAYAYIGSPTNENILTCPYDNDIATTGTISLHGNKNACTNISNFIPYQSIGLLNLVN